LRETTHDTRSTGTQQWGPPTARPDPLRFPLQPASTAPPVSLTEPHLQPPPSQIQGNPGRIRNPRADSGSRDRGNPAPTVPAAAPHARQSPTLPGYRAATPEQSRCNGASPGHRQAGAVPPGLPAVPSRRTVPQGRVGQGRITPPGTRRTGSHPASLKPSRTFHSSSSSQSCSARTSPPSPRTARPQSSTFGAVSVREGDRFSQGPASTHSRCRSTACPSSPSQLLAAPIHQPRTGTAPQRHRLLPAAAPDQLGALGKHRSLPVRDFAARVTRSAAPPQRPLPTTLRPSQARGAGAAKRVSPRSTASSSGCRGASTLTVGAWLPTATPGPREPVSPLRRVPPRMAAREGGTEPGGGSACQSRGVGPCHSSSAAPPTSELGKEQRSSIPALGDAQRRCPEQETAAATHQDTQKTRREPSCARQASCSHPAQVPPAALGQRRPQQTELRGAASLPAQATA